VLTSKRPTPKQLLGKQGEERAVEYLRQKHYQILCVNYRSKSVEADIIARDNSELVFVEVKTRTKSYGIHPSEAVDYKKMANVFQAGMAYMREHHLRMDFRCDIVSVMPNTIEHFENVSLY
jgi:putative endonuclease